MNMNEKVGTLGWGMLRVNLSSHGTENLHEIFSRPKEGQEDMTAVWSLRTKIVIDGNSKWVRNHHFVLN